MKIRIYQVRPDVGSKEMFRRYSKVDGVNPAVYRLCLEHEIEETCPKFRDELECVFSLFNDPETDELRNRNMCRSMSVSDVVEVIGSKNPRADGFYYCDAFGFRKIEFDVTKINLPKIKEM